MLLVVLLLVSLLYIGAAAASNPVVEENVKQGTRAWWQEQTREKATGPRGFATQMSLYPGEKLVLKIKLVAAGSKGVEELASVEVYRLGYYGGLGARLHGMASLLQKGGDSQPECTYEASSRMTDCSTWHASAEWMVPLQTTSGVFVAVPKSRIGTQGELVQGSYIPFVVRRPTPVAAHQRTADILFKLSDLTWVAYNKYGGWNLYRGGASMDFSSRATKASYNRPFDNRLAYPDGQHQNFLFGSEFGMLYWLEQHGYDVAYASCADIEDLDEKGLLSANKYKVLASIGHDEYWTQAMRKAYEKARDAGTHLAFFSGNEVFWRVLWAPSPATAVEPMKNRIVICRKETIENAAAPSDEEWTGTFMDPRHHVEEPQNALTGQLFMVNSYRKDAMEVTAEQGRLRFWRDTDLSDRASVDLRHGHPYHTPEGLLGYEWDVFSDDCHRPPGLILMSHTTKKIEGNLLQLYGAAYRGNGSATHRLSLYRHQALAGGPTALVFGAGTIQWSWALCSWHDGDAMLVDGNLQQATINLLADMDVQPLSLNSSSATPRLAAASASLDKEPPTSTILSPAQGHVVDVAKRGGLHVRGRAHDRGGGRVAAVEVSLDGGITWRMAEGTSHWSFHHKLRRSGEEDGKGTMSSPPSVTRRLSSTMGAAGGGHAAHHHHPSIAHANRRSHLRGDTHMHRTFFYDFCASPVGSTWHNLIAHAYNNTSALSGSTSGNSTHMSRFAVTILSRATDDSGWMERINEMPHAPELLVAPLFHHEHKSNASINAPNVVHIEILVETHDT